MVFIYSLVKKDWLHYIICFFFLISVMGILFLGIANVIHIWDVEAIRTISCQLANSESIKAIETVGIN